MGKIAILSAGNTGIAAALHVSSLGYNPMVYTRNAAKLAALQGSAISSTGVIDGLWKIHASDNLAEVLDGADFIIICTWANNHNDVFKNVRDWAKNNPGSAIRLIVFNGNWGAYEAFQILAGEDGIQKERLTIAESTGMPYVQSSCSITKNRNRVLRCSSQDSNHLSRSPMRLIRTLMRELTVFCHPLIRTC